MSGWYVVASALSSGVLVACLVPGSRRQPRSAAPRTSDPAGKPLAGVGLRSFRAVLALVTGLGVGLLMGGWLGLALGVTAAVVMWQTVDRLEPTAERRRRERLAADLPHVVDLLGCCLEAGSSIAHAVALVAGAVRSPMRDELRVISSRLALGAAPGQVWSDVARHPQLGALGRSLVRSADSGASVAGAMHRLAEDLRRGAQAEVEGRARSVGAKSAAPLGLCLLPAFILIGVVPLVAGALAGALAL